MSQYTDVLATLIREETAASDDDVEPWVVANALMGAQRAVVAGVRAKALAGLRGGPKLAAYARSQSRRALRRLERGLGDYPTKRR